MLIGLTQSIDVSPARFICRSQISPAPWEFFTAQRLNQHIRGLPAHPAVAVWKRMDKHQPVMKPDSDFIG